LRIKVAVDGVEIKSCLSLKGEFFLSVAGVTVVLSYGFKISLDFSRPNVPFGTGGLLPLSAG
jgi:hypothetical protein